MLRILEEDLEVPTFTAADQLTAVDDFIQKSELLSECNSLIVTTDKAIGRLEDFCSAIKTYGISKALVLANDPSGELAAAGLIPAYESLSDIPENADAAVEGIMDLLRSMFTSLIEQFKALGRRLGDFVGAAGRSFDTYLNILQDKRGKLNKVNIDKSKLSSKNLTSLSVVDFKRRADAVSELISRMNKLEVKTEVDNFKKIFRSGDSRAKLWEDMKDQIADAFSALNAVPNSKIYDAINITSKNDIIVIGNSKLKPSSDTIAAHKWDKATCLAAMDATIASLKAANRQVELSGLLVDSFEDIASTIFRRIKDVITFSPIKAMVRDVLNVFLAEYMNGYIRMLQAEFREINRQAAIINRVADTLIRCEA